MPSTFSIAAKLLATAALVVVGCSSETQSAPTSIPSSSTHAGGPPSGGSGPGGGDLQPITAVNLNSDGVSPGGANTAEVAGAVSALLATLDDGQRDKVSYAFTDNKERQTWSNFPSTTVPREGIVLSDLSPGQLQAAYAVLQVALNTDGYVQDVNIQKADDYLAGLGGEGASGFGSLKDYYIAVYGQPSPTEPFMVQFGGHHLARNLTYDGDKVSQTPQFVGSEPTSFQVDGVTITPVGAESTSMFGALASLTPEQRASAEITSGTFDDLLMGPGKDSGNFPAAEGCRWRVSTSRSATPFLPRSSPMPVICTGKPRRS
jgi:hypothetical protein